LLLCPTRVSLVGIELGRADGKVEGYHPRPFGCEVGSHFHQRHVSRGPPIMPDGGISQVRFKVLAFVYGPSHRCARFKRWYAYALSSDGLPTTSFLALVTVERSVLSSRARSCHKNRQAPSVPLPDVGVTSIRETYVSSEDITPRS